MKKAADVHVPQCGYPVPAWCRAANISRATFYTLPPESQPQSVKLGKRRIIIEAPQDFLRRVQSQTAKAA